MKNKLVKYVLIVLAATGILVISLSVVVYFKYSHINWLGDVDKDFFGILGEFIGGVAGTLFSIITVILVYLTYKAQQKDVIETKKLLQKQIALSIKPDLYFLNSSFYGFSRISNDKKAYALDFSNNASANIDSFHYNVIVDLVNIGVGVAKNIEFYWEFDLKEIQKYLKENFSDNPLTIKSTDMNLVEFQIKGYNDSLFLGQSFYKVKRRFDILLSQQKSSQPLQIPFPIPYLISYFIAIKLCVDNEIGKLNSFMALEDFPKCRLKLTYYDISGEKHLKTFNFLLSSNGGMIPAPSEDGVRMLGYDLYPHEVQ